MVFGRSFIACGMKGLGEEGPFFFSAVCYTFFAHMVGGLFLAASHRTQVQRKRSSPIIY